MIQKQKEIENQIRLIKLQIEKKEEQIKILINQLEDIKKKLE